MIKIALVSSLAYKELISSDRILMTAFTDNGYHAEQASWDDDKVSWKSYNAIIIRACWDYHKRPLEFIDWLDRIEKMGVLVYNSVPTIKWNAHKKYLIDIKNRGVPITSTVVVEKNTVSLLSEIIAPMEGEDFVMKPCYGADAYGVTKFTKADAGKYNNDFRQLVSKSDILIQSFVPEIVDGEISAVFIDNKYSHAVKKVPAPGDFRSNFNYKGSEQPVELTPSQKLIISELYDKCAVDSLYARFDYVPTAEGVMLMELELIEPYLFMDFYPDSAKIFVNAFERRYN